MSRAQVLAHLRGGARAGIRLFRNHNGGETAPASGRLGVDRGRSASSAACWRRNKRRPAPRFLLARQQIPHSPERPNFVSTRELNLPFSVLELSLMAQGITPCLSDAAGEAEPVP